MGFANCTIAFFKQGNGFAEMNRPLSLMPFHHKVCSFFLPVVTNENALASFEGHCMCPLLLD